MATLIFDIETLATPWQDVPAITRGALTNWVEKGNFSDEEKKRKLADVQARTSLSPFTASIISLAVYDVERKTGAVYFSAADKDGSFTDGDFKYKVRSEKEILEDFWEGAGSYDTFVSFNGRTFSLPFIYHRSIAAGVKPTVDIARSRYVTKQTPPYHVDLLDEFSFHGAMSHRPSLPLLCGAYKIPHASLLGGEEVAESYASGQHRLIAEKNAADVEAITALYALWKQNLAPRTWINATEL